MTVQELYDILSEYIDLEGNHEVVVSDSDMMRYEIENVYNDGDKIQIEIDME